MTWYATTGGRTFTKIQRRGLSSRPLFAASLPARDAVTDPAQVGLTGGVGRKTLGPAGARQVRS